MSEYDPYRRLSELKPVASFEVRSDDLREGEPIPTRFRGASAGGEDVSPHLAWSGAPEGTRSFAVTVLDPDAPTGSGFWHWAVANIPADIAELAQGAGASGSALLPAGALTLPNEVRLHGYVGAAPPPGSGRHRYVHVVHAVDVPELELDPQGTPAALGFQLFFHTLGRAVLTGWADPQE